MNTLKKILPALLLLTTLPACQKQNVQSHAKASGKGEEGGSEAVQLKEGHGLSLHPKLRASIHLEVAEVSEMPVSATFTVKLHVLRTNNGLQPVTFTPGVPGRTEASGWLTADKAERLRPGQEVELRTDRTPSSLYKGIVTKVEKAAFASLGDYEVTVQTDADLESGQPMDATFSIPAGDAVPAVPRSALLKTVEGWFVYTVNEFFFLRTPVKVGAMNANLAEITDGLYSGDQIVTSPVDTLWMAELQILRGGKACTCGH